MQQQNIETKRMKKIPQRKKQTFGAGKFKKKPTIVRGDWGTEIRTILDELTLPADNIETETEEQRKIRELQRQNIETKRKKKISP